MRFLYFYLMRDLADRVRAVAPDHAAYWRDLALGEYAGGPFADRSGGLITLMLRPAKRPSNSWPTIPSSGRTFWSATG
jgi:hypothetical protein